MQNNHISLDNISLSETSDAPVDQTQKPAMISFVMLDQTQMAFCYSHLYKVELADDRITLTFMHDTVTIDGRGMEQLYAKLILQQQHRIVVEREEHGTGNCYATDVTCGSN